MFPVRHEISNQLHGATFFLKTSGENNPTPVHLLSNYRTDRISTWAQVSHKMSTPEMTMIQKPYSKISDIISAEIKRNKTDIVINDENM